MTLALAAIALPFLAAAILASVPTGRLSARLDLGASAATLLLACALFAQSAAVAPLLRFDRLAALMIPLIAAAGLASRVASLQRFRRSRTRRSGDEVVLGSLLLTCVSAEPLLTWLALVVAAAAALYPALPRAWNRVPLAAVGLGLLWFGLVAGNTGAASAPIGLGLSILGYVTLAGSVPDMLLPVLALLLRMREGSTDGAIVSAIGPLLIGTGIGVAIMCAVWLLARSHNRSRGPVLLLGQAGVAILAFGLGGIEAVFAGLVQIILLALSGIAMLLAGHRGNERILAVAGLAGLPPFGVFPGLVLVALAAAHHSVWILLLIAAPLAALGWMAIVSLPVPIRPERVVASPAWLPLGLLVLIGWFLPDAAAEWLRTMAMEAR